MFGELFCRPTGLDEGLWMRLYRSAFTKLFLTLVRDAYASAQRDPAGPYDGRVSRATRDGCTAQHTARVYKDTYGGYMNPIPPVSLILRHKTRSLRVVKVEDGCLPYWIRTILASPF